MRKLLLIAFLGISLVACGPDVAATPISVTSQPPITPVVPDNSAFLDACTHMVVYPLTLPSLEYDGTYFAPDGLSDVSVQIMPRRRFSSEEGLSLEQLAAATRDDYAVEDVLQDFTAFPVQDYVGNELNSLASEFITADGYHIRMLVVIMPRTFLMDLMADDVVFVVTAQAPLDQWDSWVTDFDLIFNSFYPGSCGGV